MASPQRGGEMRDVNDYNVSSQGTALPAGYDSPVQDDPSSTASIEMTRMEEQPPAKPLQTTQKPLGSQTAEVPTQTPSPQSLKENQPETSSPTTTTNGAAAVPPREPLAITSANANPTSVSAAPYPLTRERTGPAIGPPLDKPAPMPQESEVAGQTLMITILLITGARHPFRIDEKYLKKRNVSIDGGNPFNMSVYTLKELIWREWRDAHAPLNFNLELSSLQHLLYQSILNFLSISPCISTPALVSSAPV
ncbi:MAG: hypothetical protein Q9218_002316 [Villophora microphyllina]